MAFDKNRGAVWWLSSAHFINDVYSGFLTPLMPFIAAKIGFSVAIATMITSIAQIVASTIQPIFGWFADKSYKRFFIFFGLFFGSISAPIATNANNLTTLLIFIILGNLGGSLYHPQAIGFIPVFSNKNTLVYNMSLFITAGTIGFACGPLVSSSVAELWGFDKIPYLSIFGLIVLALMFKFVPRVKDVKKPNSENLFEVLKQIMKNKLMVIVLTIAFMKVLIQSSCSILLPFLWKDMGHSAFYIGFAMFLFLFAGGMGSYVSSRFERKFGAKFVFYCSMILTLPLMILFITTCESHKDFSIAVFVVMGFITMFAQPVTMVLAQKLMPQYKSVIGGIINGTTWGLVALILVFVGFLAEKFGIKQILILLAILPAIFSYFVKFLPDSIDD